MNDNGHFVVSILKSILRLVGCFVALTYLDWGIMLFAIAELLGIVEEIVDKRR